MKLYVDGSPCPLSKISKLPIGFTLDALTDPQLTMDGGSLEIFVPSTVESDRIFGRAKDIHAAERFNDSRHSAVLTVDGVEMFSGTIYILSAPLNDSGEYKVRIDAGGAQWVKRAARTSLSSSGLDFGMQLTLDNIMSTWEGFQPVRFLPVLRNRYPSVYSGYSGAPLEYIMTTDDYHPFFSVAALFEKIFKGYEVKGKFFMSSELRQLYFSGQYASPDTAHQQKLLDFFARRQSRATATADEWGRVYATVSFDGDSALGNIVDTVDPTVVDCDGNTMQDTFTTGRVFTVNDDGYCQFESSIAANVGFILHLEYTTDYRIASRSELVGFNRVIAEPDVDVSFVIANSFEDQRDKLSNGVIYNLCIFDYTPGTTYLLKILNSDTDELLESHLIDSRYTKITMPSGPELRCTVEMMSGEKFEDNVDWALYPGFVAESGKTEVMIDLRIPPQEFSPGEKMQFNRIKIAGADPGMEITLSTACSLRPYFSSVPGYGSYVTLDDISHEDIWLIELVVTICKMFNLVIFTDETTKSVYIEPMENFYTTKEWEWSDRVDFSSPIEISDLGVDVARTLEWRYREGDFASKQFNKQYGTDIGTWRFTNPTYGAKQSTKLTQNSLFTTGINKTGQYALAPSASILQVGDNAAEGAMDAPFTMHVVLYMGLKPLPADERWGYPLNTNRYPLSAFLFAGDEYTEGFSLCYEDREGVAGLNRFFKESLERLATRQRLTLTLRLSPLELTQLLSDQSNYPSLRDNFRFNILGESSVYRLESLHSYDPESRSAKCTFIRLTKD